jgi:ferritin-like metal-binding protein YciE
MPLATVVDVFVEELGRQYQAELAALNTMEQFAQATPENPAFQRLLQGHVAQTRQQADNLVECSRLLAVHLPRVRPHVAEAFTRDYLDLEAAHPPCEITDLNRMLTIYEFEHWEIGVYSALLHLARGLNRGDCLPLLDANFRQEEWMAGRLNALLEHLAPMIANRTAPHAA